LPRRGDRAAKRAKSRTRLTSLMSRAIDTRMKIDDCWMAQIFPRMAWRS
jgi:hypothetical protein